MSFRSAYTEKMLTPDNAVRLIAPGDDIIVPLTAGEPPALLDALPGHEGLSGNRLFQMLSLRPALPIAPERLRIVSMFLGAGDRPGFHAGTIDLLPNHFSDVPALLQQMTRADQRVVMATVSPMDEQGYFSLGTNCDYTGALALTSKTVLLEVNEHMPRTYGKNQIHISQVTALVENHVPLPTIAEPTVTENDVTIGRTIADLIENGDTLQIGIGAIPNAVMDFLMGHRDLTIFTEMLPDKVVDLYQAGVITGSNNVLAPGKMTTTFALGSSKLYDFLHENRGVALLPVDQTNDLRIVAKHDNIVSINSTVEVDLLGQCNSEAVGGRYYSSTGGQSDFAKGVRLAKNGRGIICLHATAKRGEISKIVPVLPPG
ncbi:MAG: acetyl-CoA hydrolase/transferase C-terminal domain-containing protein, partial [Tumebacillaceae bacterium]